MQKNKIENIAIYYRINPLALGDILFPVVKASNWGFFSYIFWVDFSRVHAVFLCLKDFHKKFQGYRILAAGGSGLSSKIIGTSLVCDILNSVNMSWWS